MKLLVIETLDPHLLIIDKAMVEVCSTNFVVNPCQMELSFTTLSYFWVLHYWCPQGNFIPTEDGHNRGYIEPENPIKV